MKRIVFGAAFAALSSAALAQSRSAFFDVQAFSDVTVTGGPLSYTVTLGANPKFMFGGNWYTINDIFGFYILSNDGDLNATGSDFTGIASWDFRSNDGGVGGVGGWHTPAGSSNGLNAGESETFTFTSINAAEIDQPGFHVRSFDFNFPGGGNTGFMTVPEPGTLAALAIGAAALLLRRKR